MTDIPGDLLPKCPECGANPAIRVGLEQAFCENESCKVLMWNPRKTYEENFANPSIIDLPDLP